MSRTDQGAQAAPTAAALYETGLQHLRAGRHLDAQICCQQALAIDASHADSMHLMGLMSLQAGQYDHAVEWLSRAIRQTPSTNYLSTLGIALKQMGRLDDALSMFDKAVQLKPDDAELWKHVGGVLLALDRAADALLSFQHVLKLDPRHFGPIRAACCCTGWSASRRRLSSSICATRCGRITHRRCSCARVSSAP